MRGMTLPLCVVCVVAISVTTGCQRYAPKPAAISFPYSEQEKLQALSHWKISANELGENIRKKLASLSISSVYMESPSDSSPPFSKTYTKFLASKLSQSGISVSFNDSSRTEVYVESSLLVHSASRRTTLTPELPYAGFVPLALLAGGGTALGFAIAGADDILYPVGIGALGAGTGLVIHLNQKYLDPEATEVAVFVGLRQGSELLYSENLLYYVNPGDVEHYTGPPKQHYIAVTNER